jgi:hypothetical protein
MPPRQNELPEGTDHIINGAMETGGRNTGGGGGGGSDAGFIGTAEGAIDDTGGTRTESGGRAATALREGVANIRQTATDRARQYADDGKARASDSLDELSRAVEEAAQMIDERLGEQYGDYARRAAEAVTTFSTNLREREVEDIYQDVAGYVRKSPGVAIGAAAIVGFTLVRLLRAGMEQDQPRRRSQGGSAGKSRKRKSSADAEA